MEAYGALLAEYARRRDAEAALWVLQDFFERGGTPDDQMFDTVMDLCMRTGEFRRAMQVSWPYQPLHFLRTLVSSNSDSCAPRGKYKGTVLVIRFAQIFTMLCSPEQNHEGSLEDWY